MDPAENGRERGLRGGEGDGWALPKTAGDGGYEGGI